MTEAAEQPDDVELLERSAAGDRQAFTRFMGRHDADVHRFVASLGAGPDEADDILQECFVAAWRSAGTFRGLGSARGWLFSIARNSFRRHRRRRVGEPEELASLEELGEQAGWGSDDDLVASMEARETILWAMDRLTPEEREIVVLRDVEGLSGEEAADILGIGVAAMKSRLHRARLRLLASVRERERRDHA